MNRLSLAAILLALHAISATAAERPNVVLVIADDMSWHDAGCYGNREAATKARRGR